MFWWFCVWPLGPLGISTRSQCAMTCVCVRDDPYTLSCASFQRLCREERGAPVRSLDLRGPHVQHIKCINPHSRRAWSPQWPHWHFINASLPRSIKKYNHRLRNFYFHRGGAPRICAAGASAADKMHFRTLILLYSLTPTYWERNQTLCKKINNFYTLEINILVTVDFFWHLRLDFCLQTVGEIIVHAAENKYLSYLCLGTQGEPLLSSDRKKDN